MYYNVEETAARIKKLRVAAEETQDVVAEKLGISKGYYSQVERSTRTPSIDLFIEIAELYNVSLDYLLLGKAFGDQLKKEIHLIACQIANLEKRL